ncbi:twin-arginine translocase TatA/TatE family subunit [Leucobacter albus]|uniref:Sec-independent protein translocase protein TatA n=1 Tax=Leucobacter albus TaxID=272210 RepID=A0ABW3TPR9_9MICO
MGGPTLIVIVFIVLLLFGAPKLPALAKSLGQSMKILKKEVRSDDDTTGTADGAGTDGTPGADPESPKKPE